MIGFGRLARACANPTRCRCPPLSSYGNFANDKSTAGRAQRFEDALYLLLARLRPIRGDAG